MKILIVPKKYVIITAKMMSRKILYMYNMKYYFNIVLSSEFLSSKLLSNLLNLDISINLISLGSLNNLNSFVMAPDDMT
jgi:hypothetical protein